MPPLPGNGDNGTSNSPPIQQGGLSGATQGWYPPMSPVQGPQQQQGAVTPAPQQQLRPFTPETNYLSLAGYQRLQAMLQGGPAAPFGPVQQAVGQTASHALTMPMQQMAATQAAMTAPAPQAPAPQAPAPQAPVSHAHNLQGSSPSPVYGTQQQGKVPKGGGQSPSPAYTTTKPASGVKPAPVKAAAGGTMTDDQASQKLQTWSSANPPRKGLVDDPGQGEANTMAQGFRAGLAGQAPPVQQKISQTQPNFNSPWEIRVLVPWLRQLMQWRVPSAVHRAVSRYND